MITLPGSGVRNNNSHHLKMILSLAKMKLPIDPDPTRRDSSFGSVSAAVLGSILCLAHSFVKNKFPLPLIQEELIV